MHPQPETVAGDEEDIGVCEKIYKWINRRCLNRLCDVGAALRWRAIQVGSVSCGNGKLDNGAKSPRLSNRVAEPIAIGPHPVSLQVACSLPQKEFLDLTSRRERHVVHDDQPFGHIGRGDALCSQE
jgi:hypothetical protein